MSSPDRAGSSTVFDAIPCGDPTLGNRRSQGKKLTSTTRRKIVLNYQGVPVSCVAATCEYDSHLGAFIFQRGKSYTTRMPRCSRRVSDLSPRRASLRSGTTSTRRRSSKVFLGIKFSETRKLSTTAFSRFVHFFF